MARSLLIQEEGSFFMKKMMMKEERITVAVHGGTFHADDVLCVAMLMHFFGKDRIRVVRTRDVEKLEKCDFVLDVGKRDEISEKVVWLDHHQKDSLVRPNGIKAAACGKLADYLFAGNEGIRNRLFRSLIYAVEALDNGQDLNDFGLGSSKMEYVDAFIPTYLETEGLSQIEQEKIFDAAFLSVVDIAFSQFERELAIAEAAEKAYQMVNKIIFQDRSNAHLLELDRYFPWKEAVLDYNNNRGLEKKILLVAFPSMDGDYRLQVVPKEDGRFASWINLPVEWVGVNEKNAIEKGLPGCIFCHSARFMAVFDTKQHALAAAEKIVVREL